MSLFSRAAEERRAGRWGPARSILAGAARSVGEEAPKDLLAELRRAEADLAVSEAVEAARLRKLTLGNDGRSGSDFRLGPEGPYAVAISGYVEKRKGGAVNFGTFDGKRLAERIDDTGPPADVRERLVAALDDWGLGEQDERLRATVLDAARRLDPDPWRDQLRDPAVWGDRALLERIAQRVDRTTPPRGVLLLAALLPRAGALPEAEALLRRATLWRPDDFWALVELGAILDREPTRPEAESLVTYIQKPGGGGGWASPEVAERKTEAGACYRAALALRPGDPLLYHELGVCLLAIGRTADAEPAFREAIALHPRFYEPSMFLVDLLRFTGRSAETLAVAQDAVRRRPDLPAAHTLLGSALQDAGRLDEAVAAYNRARELGDDEGIGAVGLASVLVEAGRFDEAKEIALAETRRADNHFSFWLLGWVYGRAGQFGPSADAYDRAVALWPAGDRVTELLAYERDRNRRYATAEAALSNLTQGGDLPDDPRLCLDVADLCMLRGTEFPLALRLSRRAFAAEPALEEDLDEAYRYNAACFAVLSAAAGQAADGTGEDVGAGDAAVLRNEALGWLSADVEARRRVAKDHQHFQWFAWFEEHLRHCLDDPDLAPVRGEALGRLPEAERAAWGAFWDHVSASLRAVGPIEAERPGVVAATASSSGAVSHESP